MCKGHSKDLNDLCLWLNRQDSGGSGEGLCIDPHSIRMDYMYNNNEPCLMILHPSFWFDNDKRPVLPLSGCTFEIGQCETDR